jgi:hypothetical protein
VSTRQKTSAEVSEPFASSPGEPTICLHFPTTPGFSTGATVSRRTALELIQEIRKALGQDGRVIIYTDRHGMLWERPLKDGEVTIDREDRALLDFLTGEKIDVHIAVRDR